MRTTTARNGRPESPLRDARNARGMRQADVAEKAGCAISMVSMCESGYVPALGTQEAIAAALGASVGSFWRC